MELSTLEKIQYEARPFAYGIGSAFCLVNASDRRILFFSGVLLGFAGGYIYKMRREYRAKRRDRAY